MSTARRNTHFYGQNSGGGVTVEVSIRTLAPLLALALLRRRLSRNAFRNGLGCLALGGAMGRLFGRQKELSNNQAKVTKEQAKFSTKLIDFDIPEGEGFVFGNTRVTYDGYVKHDAISQRTSGGQLPDNSILRDSLIPVAVPVGGELSDCDIAGSYFKVDKPIALAANQVTDESWNGIVNLTWNPVGPLNVGFELMYAERSLEDGRSGNLQRTQFSTQYHF